MLSPIFNPTARGYSEGVARPQTHDGAGSQPSAVSDHGGDDALTTLEKAYITKLVSVDITVRLLAADIARRGLLTAAGGVRNVNDKFLAAGGTDLPNGSGWAVGPGS